MLGLQLRDEFRGSHMPGTQINLSRMVGIGSAKNILDITYPTADVRNVLKALANSRARAVVIVGERGRGKSHLQSVAHYAFADPTVVDDWAHDWATAVDDSQLASLRLPQGFTPVTAVLSDQEDPSLWNLIFRTHAKEDYLRGRFIESATPMPSKSLMIEAFEERPTALVLDELQTWFDSLANGGGGSPRALAFNFIQILSELAASRPDILRLVVSVRSSESDAYRQIHRDMPLLIDFQGAGARLDRTHLIQHRLFENHRSIPRSSVEASVWAYADERVRLLYPAVVGPAQDEARAAVAEAWPFAPELVDILEDEFLTAAAAQETRDLMRVLALMYKAQGERVPLLTVADIDVTLAEGAGAELASIVDVTTGSASRLLEVARRNLTAVADQGLSLPDATEIVSALWVRSLSQRPQAGATAAQLHVDITRKNPVDDNAFQAELTQLTEASFNIHLAGQRFIFRTDENPRAKLVASSRNDKLFEGGRDLRFIQQASEAALSPMEGATSVVSRLIALGPDWQTDPWEATAPDSLPSTWRQPVVLVLPELATDSQLAGWLKDNVPDRRNLVRFYMPGTGSLSPYADPEIRERARCTLLAMEWTRTDKSYSALINEFRRPLLDRLRKTITRLAVLQRWDYGNPPRTRFTIDTVNADSQGALKAVEDHIATAVFDPDLFADHVRSCAARRLTVLDALATLMEPPTSPDATAIPYLGETALLERIIRLAASGEIGLNLQGTWYGRLPSDLDTESCLARIRPRVFRTGPALKELVLADRSEAPQPFAQSGASGGINPLGTGHPLPTTVPTTGYPDNVREGGQPSWQVTTRSSSGARKPVNLMGDLHSWALPPDPIEEVRLKARGLTPTRLQEILKRLPADVELVLEVDLKEQVAL